MNIELKQIGTWQGRTPFGAVNLCDSAVKQFGLPKRRKKIILRLSTIPKYGYRKVSLRRGGIGLPWKWFGEGIIQAQSHEYYFAMPNETITGILRELFPQVVGSLLLEADVYVRFVSYRTPPQEKDLQD